MKTWPFYYLVGAIVLAPHLDATTANVIGGVALLAAIVCL